MLCGGFYLLQYTAVPECDGEEVDCLPAPQDTGGVPCQEGMHHTFPSSKWA